MAAGSHRHAGDCRSQGLEFGRDGRIQAISGIWGTLSFAMALRSVAESVFDRKRECRRRARDPLGSAAVRRLLPSLPLSESGSGWRWGPIVVLQRLTRTLFSGCVGQILRLRRSDSPVA